MQRLDIVIARSIDALRPHHAFDAEHFEQEHKHKNERVRPETIRPVVDRPLGPWGLPVGKVRVRRRRRW